MLMGPLSLVVGISMIKDGFEDNKRRKQDNEENNMMCEAAPRGTKKLEKMKSLEI